MTFTPTRPLTEPERLLFGLLHRLDPEDAAPLAQDILRSIIVPRGQNPATSEQIVQLSAQLTTTLNATLTEIRTMSDSFTQELAQLQADVTQQGSVIASAETAFQGLSALLAAAEAEAKTANATPEQLAAFVTVRQGLEANTAKLAAAIPVNTPAEASSPPPTSTPPDAAASAGVTAGTAEGTPLPNEPAATA